MNMSRYSEEQRAAWRKTTNEIWEKYYGANVKIDDEPVPLPVTKRPKVIVTPETKPVEVAPVPEVKTAVVSDVKLPKTVASIIGKTFDSVTVLSYNREESLIPRGKKNMPLPHVNCKCKCGKEFVVNAYRVSGGSQKSCGCK
jgi:hypothetical protein